MPTAVNLDISKVLKPQQMFALLFHKRSNKDTCLAILERRVASDQEPNDCGSSQSGCLVLFPPVFPVRRPVIHSH